MNAAQIHLVKMVQLVKTQLVDIIVCVKPVINM